jgi:signal transduction histidine kinase
MYRNFLNSLSFTARYIFALSIIALLAILAYINLSNHIEKQANYGKIINLSGKQRMLTQKIALHSIYYKTKKLEKSLYIMKNSHEYLISLPMSKKLHNIYFAEPVSLDKRVKQYLKHANDFKTNRSGKSLTYILNNSDTLLVDFDKVVSYYQDEIEYKTYELSQKELYLLLLTLFILTIEAIFIFRPANNMINDSRVKLLQQSRSSAMGEMIENIAHQWRQPLSAISTIASGSKLRKKMNLITDDEVLESYDKIMNHTKHLSTTIDDFRSFFKQDTNKTIFSIKNVINQCKSLSDASYKSNNIILSIDIKDDIEIEGSYGEMSQVILNILNNAKDVLIEKNYEEKIVKITAYKIKDKYCISIHDNAGGVPSDIINKIFEPYFTTKHKSQGTGIGLFMSKEIITKHFKGSIEIVNKKTTHENKIFYGACFKIMLLIS